MQRGGDIARTVSVTCGLAEPVELARDRLVLAVGSVTRTLPTPGLKHKGLGLKTLVEAEEANRCHDVAPGATL